MVRHKTDYKYLLVLLSLSHAVRSNFIIILLFNVYRLIINLNNYKFLPHQQLLYTFIKKTKKNNTSTIYKFNCFLSNMHAYIYMYTIVVYVHVVYTLKLHIGKQIAFHMVIIPIRPIV